MNEWMDEQMDGQMNEWMDEQMDGQMNGWMDGQMNEQNQIGWMNTKLTKHMTTNDNDQVHNICGMPVYIY